MTKRPNPDHPPVLRLSLSLRQRLTAMAGTALLRPLLFGPLLLGPLLLGPLLLGTAACSGNASSAVSTAKAEDQIAFGVEMARRQLWNEALFRFEQAQRMDPSNPRVYNNLAVACEATGQFDKALEYYKEALRREPGNQELKKNYARFVEFYRGFTPAEEEGESP